MVTLITGKVASGKSTAILKIADMLGRKRCAGLLAQEILSDGERVGFETGAIHNGDRIVLAHKETDKTYQVEDYGVDIPSFEQLCRKELEAALLNDEISFILIDEIGRMQMMSKTFNILLNRMADSYKPLIASICYDNDVEQIAEFKRRNDVVLYTLDENNRDELPLRIVEDLCKEDPVYMEKLNLAKIYRSQPERYAYEKDKIVLHSTHGIRTITRDEIYHCDCDYYKENGVCSHILSLLLPENGKE